MKVSEVIQQLQQKQQEHGDQECEVVMRDVKGEIFDFSGPQENQPNIRILASGRGSA